MRWFTQRWRFRPEWLAEVSKLAEDAYKAAKKQWSDDIPQRRSPRPEQTVYEAFNALSEDNDENELHRYLNSPRLKGSAAKDPLKW